MTLITQPLHFRFCSLSRRRRRRQSLYYTTRLCWINNENRTRLRAGRCAHDGHATTENSRQI